VGKAKEHPGMKGHQSKGGKNGYQKSGRNQTEKSGVSSNRQTCSAQGKVPGGDKKGES